MICRTTCHILSRAVESDHTCLVCWVHPENTKLNIYFTELQTILWQKTIILKLIEKNVNKSIGKLNFKLFLQLPSIILQYHCLEESLLHTITVPVNPVMTLNHLARSQTTKGLISSIAKLYFISTLLTCMCIAATYSQRYQSRQFEIHTVVPSCCHNNDTQKHCPYPLIF